MSNPYYTEAFAGSAGQTALAEQVTSEFLGVQAGFLAVYDQMITAIQGQPGETLTPLGNAAARANNWMKFNASGNPIITASPLNPRGAWAASTLYNVGDAYTSTPNGSLYYVTTQYTSGATFGSTDTANTIVLVNLAGLFFANYSIVTGPATISPLAGQSFFTDSSGGDIVINLPTATLGDSPINITVVGGSLTGSQLQTVNSASGQYIMGNTQTALAIDVANASMSFMYGGATYGWRLRTMG